jgi:uncharacterized damage-inducible protein DinB
MIRTFLPLALGTVLMAQAPAPAPAAPAVKKTDGQAINQMYAWVGGQFVPAADAMPEEKWGFAPKDGEFKGVKTFAQQVKHVAAVNYFMGSKILGEDMPAEAGKIDMSNIEMGPDAVKTKAEIMAYLKGSFAYAKKAIDSINDKNATESMKNPFGMPGDMTRLGLATLIAFHGMDHYGQMVVYLRMNNIIPPASRQQAH